MDPEARPVFGTRQGRLPQELRLKNIQTPEEANAFLNNHYIGEFNSKFAVAASDSIGCC